MNWPFHIYLVWVSIDIQLNVKQNYHLSNILIKDYLITSTYFHRVWIIFCFVQFVLQQLNLSSKINISMKKFSSSNVTTGMLSKNFKKIAETLVTSGKGFVFMNTSAFWERFQLEVLATIRQLGCPPFFMTLSFADLHWNDYIANIFKLKRQKISAENIINMSYFQKCEILNEIPVFAARHFQYRVDIFFTEILMGSNHLGKIKYYAVRVEFQFRGSPHIHSFL